MFYKIQLFYLCFAIAYNSIQEPIQGGYSYEDKTPIIFIFSSCIFFTACNTIEANDASEQTTTGSLYEDRVISFVVPFQAGGGTDVFARFMTPYFSEHISGSPRVQVENIPGGGSITGTNEYAQTRKPNGRNILTTSGSSHIPYILGQGSVQYDLSNMTPIIGSPSGGVVYTNPEKALKVCMNLLRHQENFFMQECLQLV